MMDTPETYLLLALLLFIGGSMAAFYFLYHKPRRMMAARAAVYFRRSAIASGGVVEERWYSVSLSTARYGRKAGAVFLMKPGGHKELFLRIHLDLKMTGSFLIQPALISMTQNPLESLEWVGLGSIAPKLAGVDPRLDSILHFHSFREDFVKSNFKDERRVKALLQAFSMGARRIIFNGKTLSLDWEPLDPAILDHEPKLIGQGIERLSEIANGMTPAPARSFMKSLEGLSRAEIGHLLLLGAGAIVYIAIKIYMIAQKNLK